MHGGILSRWGKGLRFAILWGVCSGEACCFGFFFLLRGTRL